MTDRKNSPRAVLTQAGYAAIGAGDVLAGYVRGVSKELPGRARHAARELRENLPGTLRNEFDELATRGRRLTGHAPVSPPVAPIEPPPETTGPA
ncbi:MAG: hypothetical protein ACRDZO_25215 [Egibacteraceae bacterium]